MNYGIFYYLTSYNLSARGWRSKTARKITKGGDWRKPEAVFCCKI
jgi:hypothetical protein